MQILRKSSFTPTPWKNGGGITHEAVRVPGSGDSFLWRVSVAHIEVSGPFSNFAEHERKMVLLHGSGVCLRFGEGPPTYLREVGDLVQFDGAVSTQCELLSGPCADLNLMVSKSMKGTRAWVERLRTSRALQPHRGTRLVFAITGIVSLAMENCDILRLRAWDLAVVSPADRVILGPATQGEIPASDKSAAPLVFLATLDDPSA